MLESMRGLLCAALLALPLAAAAQQNLPLWEIGVVAGAVSSPAYPAADDRSSRLLVLPAPIYRGKIFRSDESGIGARLFRSDLAEFDVGFAASLPSRSDDVDARAGMPDLGTLVEFGPRLKLTLMRSESGRLRLDLPLRTVIEGRGGLRNQGWNFAPRLSYQMGDRGNGWSGDVHVGLSVASDKLNRYFYDVRPEYATAQRPAYEAKSGLVLVRTGASASRKINPDLRVFGYVWYENYARSANDESPLFRKTSGTAAGVGLLWTLARSSRRAGDSD